jgi:hypothetical protein
MALSSPTVVVLRDALETPLRSLIGINPERLD